MGTPHPRYIRDSERGWARRRRRGTMHGSKNDLPILFGADEAAIRGTDWGGMRAMIVSLPTGTDITPLLKGLSGDRCTCPHWGYIVKGRMRAISADGEETLQAGDVFYMAPGHT